MSKRKEEIIADHIHIVGGKVQENLKAPNGLVYPEDVETLQVNLLMNVVEHLASTLVDVKKTYPVKDTVDLKLTTDFVVMRRENFDELFRETFCKGKVNEQL